MQAAENMKMVNGRVNERTVKKAARILRENGLTVSAFIRNSLECVAREGVVPESGFEETHDKLDVKALKGIVSALEAKPMPGRSEFDGVPDDAILGHLRMERYGY